MTTISELIAILEEIKKKHGDIPVRKLDRDATESEFYPCYEDVEDEDVWFATDREEPEISVNPYADGFVVIE